MNNYKEEAVEMLKNYKYELLASGEEAEVWSCRKHDFIAYGFIISSTPMGISVIGDIGNYTFDTARGIEFLSGDDMNHIHQKLDKIYKSTEFAKEHFRESIIIELRELFDNNEYFRSHMKSESLLENMKSCSKDVESFYNNEMDNINDSDFKQDLILYLKEAINIDSYEEAAMFIRNNDFIDMFDTDYDYKKTSDKTMQMLHIVNQAAKKIIEIKSKSLQ